MAGEQTFRVPSLSLPDPRQAQTAEGLSQYEAVRLFIERARAVQPSFSVTDANAPAVAQVCFCLDGIPLAIELAAVRVRSLSVEEVNARLDQRFRLLTGGSRNVLPRQQTLRALIDWSYDLLTGPEKTLLRRLAVFAGGIEDWEVLDLLTALVDKSLVVYEEGADGVAGRYRLSESVRQYAGDRLGESGEAEAAPAPPPPSPSSPNRPGTRRAPAPPARRRRGRSEARPVVGTAAKRGLTPCRIIAGSRLKVKTGGRVVVRSPMIVRGDSHGGPGRSRRSP